MDESNEATISATTAHRGQVDPGEWWACDFPERPADPDWTIFDVRCPSCLLAGDVAVQHLALWSGMDVRTESDPDGDEPWSVADFWLWRNGSYSSGNNGEEQNDG